jgi:hypothetical protein
VIWGNVLASWARPGLSKPVPDPTSKTSQKQQVFDRKRLSGLTVRAFNRIVLVDRFIWAGIFRQGLMLNEGNLPPSASGTFYKIVLLTSTILDDP